MKVKIDFSPNFKKNFLTDEDIIVRPGMYGIYMRKHFWNSWKCVATYADLKFAELDVKRLSGFPKRY